MGLLVRDLNFWGPGSQWETKTCHLGIGFGRLRILADQAFQPLALFSDHFVRL